MKDLERAAEDMNDSEMSTFLADIRNQFPEVFAIDRGIGVVRQPAS